MGRLLERLLADSESAPAATPATLATLPGSPSRNVAESQESQGGGVGKTQEQRMHLLTLAADEGLPAELVHGLDDAGMTACDGLADATLRASLRAIERGRRMDAGQVPPEWGEPVMRTCEGCGPVLLWPECPAVVKVCPWCFRRRAGKAIPRPLVTCGDCQHYRPDTVNPGAGMGRCALGAGCAYWPMKPHRCADWRE